MRALCLYPHPSSCQKLWMMRSFLLQHTCIRSTPIFQAHPSILSMRCKKFIKTLPRAKFQMPPNLRILWLISSDERGKSKKRETTGSMSLGWNTRSVLKSLRLIIGSKSRSWRKKSSIKRSA